MPGVLVRNDLHCQDGTYRLEDILFGTFFFYRVQFHQVCLDLHTFDQTHLPLASNSASVICLFLCHFLIFTFFFVQFFDELACGCFLVALVVSLFLRILEHFSLSFVFLWWSFKFSNLEVLLLFLFFLCGFVLFPLRRRGLSPFQVLRELLLMHFLGSSSVVAYHLTDLNVFFKNNVIHLNQLGN